MVSAAQLSLEFYLATYVLSAAVVQSISAFCYLLCCCNVLIKYYAFDQLAYKSSRVSSSLKAGLVTMADTANGHRTAFLYAEHNFPLNRRQSMQALSLCQFYVTSKLTQHTAVEWAHTTHCSADLSLHESISAFGIPTSARRSLAARTKSSVQAQGIPGKPIYSVFEPISVLFPSLISTSGINHYARRLADRSTAQQAGCCNCC
jgi:hypothetical protein